MRINNRIEALRETVRMFIEVLYNAKEVIVKNSVEIAIVTFSSECNETTWHSLEYWVKNPYEIEVVPQGGSAIASAVLKSIQLIERRLEELDGHEIEPYLPYLILVTDGDPDDTEKQSIVEESVKSVLSHCETSSKDKHLIAPYIIGVGKNVNEELLNRFSTKFIGEAILFDEKESVQKTIFKELFLFISNSVTNSLKGTADLRELYKELQKEAQKHIREPKLIHKNRRIKDADAFLY